jgi:hypothetical protein
MVLPAEGHLAIGKADEAVIGNRHPVCLALQILQHVRWKYSAKTQADSFAQANVQTLRTRSVRRASGLVQTTLPETAHRNQNCAACCSIPSVMM